MSLDCHPLANRMMAFRFLLHRGQRMKYSRPERVLSTLFFRDHSWFLESFLLRWLANRFWEQCVPFHAKVCFSGFDKAEWIVSRPTSPWCKGGEVQQALKIVWGYWLRIDPSLSVHNYWVQKPSSWAPLSYQGCIMHCNECLGWKGMRTWHIPTYAVLIHSLF